MATLNMNLANAEVQTFGALPAGKYPAKITASEIKATKAGDGTYLACTWEVLDGPFKGRKFFSNYNLTNPSVQAVQIAANELKTMATAIGHPNPNFIGDSAELHNRPCVVTLTVRPAQGQYGEGNDVKGYAKIEGGAQQPAVPAFGQAQYAPPPSFAGQAPQPPAPAPMPQPPVAFQPPAPPVAAPPAMQFPELPQAPDQQTGGQPPAPTGNLQSDLPDWARP